MLYTDTVGFIRDLPEELVNAFRATLEELHDADLLMHVVDGANPGAPDRVDAVNRIVDDATPPAECRQRKIGLSRNAFGFSKCLEGERRKEIEVPAAEVVEGIVRQLVRCSCSTVRIFVLGTQRRSFA